MIPFGVWLFILMALLAGLGLFIRKTLCVVTVIGDSMLPNLCSGEQVVICRRRLAGKVKKGKVVIVVPPYMAPYSQRDSAALLFSNRAFIKRVTALSGEEQVVSAHEYVPGMYLPFAASDQKRPTPQRSVDGQYKWDVPPGHCFVMSDNRKSRSDSRYWGPVPLRSVLGVVIMKLPHRAGNGQNEAPIPVETFGLPFAPTRDDERNL